MRGPLGLDCFGDRAGPIGGFSVVTRMMRPPRPPVGEDAGLRRKARGSERGRGSRGGETGKCGGG